MLGEFKIRRPSRRCDVSGEALQPGDVYYSVLSEAGDDFRRRDIKAAAWEGPPEDCVGWWKNQVPPPRQTRRELAPPDVLLELLRAMEDQPQNATCRYLLALMLLRTRTLKQHETLNFAAPASPDADSPAAEVMTLIAGDDAVINVPICRITASQAKVAQAELEELIYREVEVIE